ncbi:WD40 repeat domain-containing protein [Zavarzinella formosa]|uniref:WD40 repeat domain-containing protein n=1 Tax=Zavarzinella formosa TaxID=360055 RepID=UPI00031DFD95|nr:WD40 repeat domain-containing protein [Zavarzinella formosa]
MNTRYFRSVAISTGLAFLIGLASSSGQQPETPKTDPDKKAGPKDAKGVLPKAQAKNRPGGGRGGRQAPADVTMTLGDPLKHWDVVRGVAHSPDGRWFATASDDGSVKLRDLNTGKETFTLKAGRNQRLSVAFYDVAFSPDSKTLAAASADKTIRLWDVATGEVKQVLAGHYDAVAGIAFRPDGKALASASDDRSVRIWDLEHPKAHEGTPIIIPGVTDPILTPLALLDAIGDFASAVAWSPDSRLIAIGLWDKTVQIYDASAYRQVKTLGGHGGRISSLSFSADSKTLVSAALDGSVRVWDTGTWESRAALTPHKGATFSAKLSPDGKTFATAGLDRAVRLWSAADGKPIRQVTTHQGPVLALSWAPDGKKLSSGSSDAAVKFTPLENVQDGVRPAGTLLSVAYSADGKTLVTGDDSGTLRLWDSESGRELKALAAGSQPLNAVAAAKDGRLAAGSDSGKVYVWAMAEEKPVELGTHKDAVRSLAFSPDGKTLYSGGADKAVNVWEAATGKLIRTLSGHDGSVTTITFLPDGQTVVTGADDRHIKVWEAADGRLIRTLDPDEDDDVLTVAVCPDGKQLVSTGSREVPPTIKFWDPASGAVQKLLPGHTDRPLHAAYHPDGKLLATVAGDGTIRLWDPLGFKLINTIALRTPRGTISQVVFHPKGDRVATVNGNGTVTVVKLPESAKAETEPNP